MVLETCQRLTGVALKDNKPKFVIFLLYNINIYAIL